MDRRGPALAVDAVVFDAEERLLLIRRKFAPFKGRYALPGGFVERGETVEQAARRELMEETGVVAPPSQRLIGVYSNPKRDPRGHTVSVAFLMRVGRSTPNAGDDAARAAFIADWRGKKLAFDHSDIVADALALLSAPRPARRRSPPST